MKDTDSQVLNKKILVSKIRLNKRDESPLVMSLANSSL